MDGGKDAAISALSLPQGWSQLPLEVLGIILSNLQQNDLLRSRLVCRSWNQESRRVLQKPGAEFHQTLTETNINHYIDFLHNWECLAEVIRLPFHLNINLNIMNSEGPGNQCYKTKLNKLTANVRFLRDNFGEECVAKFTLRTPRAVNFPHEYDFTRFWLIEFLVMISPGLKELDLSDFNVKLGRYTNDEIKSSQLFDLKFPKLTTLTCNKVSREDELFTIYVVAIYPSIVSRSPNMENLMGINAPGLIRLPVNFDKLRTLLIEETIQEPSNVLQKFQSNSPQLQILAFSLEHYSESAARTEVFHRILEFLSPTLKSLTVTTMEVTAGTQTAPLMRFPRLTNLQHLKISVNIMRNTEDWIFYDPDEINFNPEFLPSLKSVELPLGFLLTAQSDRNVCLKEEFEVPVKFSTVKDLTILIKHTRWSVWMSQIGVYNGDGALKHLQKVFPNVSKLSIVNESIHSTEQQKVKHLLQFLIRSPLSAKIQEVCIEGFESDFMGQVLGQMDSLREGQGTGVDLEVVQAQTQAGTNNSFFMTNVRKIRLGLSAVTHIKCTSNDPYSHLLMPVPNLTAMAKYFPVLQSIEISSILFRWIFDIEREELIQTLNTAFPYLWIHVIP